MECCSPSGKNHKTMNDEYCSSDAGDKKKNSWIYWIVVLLIILLFFSLLR